MRMLRTMCVCVCGNKTENRLWLDVRPINHIRLWKRSCFKMRHTLTHQKKKKSTKLTELIIQIRPFSFIVCSLLCINSVLLLLCGDQDIQHYQLICVSFGLFVFVSKIRNMCFECREEYQERIHGAF